MAQKGKSWQQKAIDAILKKRTFDVEADGNGWSFVYQMVTDEILSGLSPQKKILAFGEAARHVEQIFHAALTEIEEKHKQPVYRYRPEGKRALHYITLDAEYHEAKQRDLERVVADAQRKKRAIRRHLELAAPEAFLRLQTNGKLLLPFEKEGKN